MAELALWGDVGFDVTPTFSDSWTSGTTTVIPGSAFTLPTITNITGLVVTGSVDSSVLGIYDVSWSKPDVSGIVKRVTRRFVVDYPTVAFHYAGFVATDYGGLYSTKEDAATDGFIYADTPDGTYSWGTLSVVSNTTSNTEYTWTPPSAMTADVLMVAGGGGGGEQVGGGGGAGGLLFNQDVSLSGQEIIVVGNGGAGAIFTTSGPNEANLPSKGNDTSFTGLTTALGGGGGGSYSGGAATSGGSGGGGEGTATTGAAGTPGPPKQGNAGGNGFNNSWAGGGGGGAGAPGDNATANIGGDGGEGADMSSTFGTTYGDSGWFAGGGGGCGNTTSSTDITSGGQGGGASGRNQIAGQADDAQKHTGGGGGGARDYGNGSAGGSGIVLVKQTSYLLEATFSDAWTSGTTYVTLGSTFTLPTITNITGVTVTGSVDSATAGTYDVTWSKVVGGILRSVTRRFIVDYPTVAFHYAGFVATDYDSAYSTKEAAAAAGFFYADTPSLTNDPVYGTLTIVSNTTSNTEYTWTPPAAMTANVLMVAGGGGGGGHVGGGGGAGGLLFNENISLSGQKTIVVGNGGAGGSNETTNQVDRGINGANSLFTGLTTVIGGGGGGSYSGTESGTPGKIGGSGGGGGHSNQGGSGTVNQGYQGGDSFDQNTGGGGGGSGSVGDDAISGNGGNGGSGYYSSIFTNVYGDSGWFASGGGGCGRAGRSTPGVGVIGGGGDGTDGSENGGNGMVHTGGGGGGTGVTASGGNGGSGIVLVKQTI